MNAPRFWETKTLADMTSDEWEALCDGCGRCCLVKLEDADDGEIYFTDVACQLLDHDSCRCKDYPHRQARVPDCVALSPQTVSRISWLPQTCAYRLLDEGRKLHAWHPLISGDPASVHRAGISVRGAVVCETKVKPEHLEDHVIHWIE
ncbi:MAG: YcgN family cysteine cluster protein [Porticoccaceae bacterium]